MMAAMRVGGEDTNLGSVPDAAHGMVGEHEVGGGANDGSHEGGGRDTNLGSVPGAVHGMVGEHEVGGGANDGSHEGGGEEPPHDLPVHAGAVSFTCRCTIE